MQAITPPNGLEKEMLSENASALVNYKEAARFLGVPLGTLYAWVSQRKITHVRLGPRLVRFSVHELQKMIQAQTCQAVESSQITTDGGVTC